MIEMSAIARQQILGFALIRRQQVTNLNVMCAWPLWECCAPIMECPLYKRGGG